MTTLVALASKHTLVMGTDSLGTDVRRMIPLSQLYQYFYPDNEFKIRLDDDGTPALRDLDQMYYNSELVPYNQLLHMRKLFQLGNIPLAVMFTGISSIGSSPISNLLDDFAKGDKGVNSGGSVNYTVNSVAKRLLEYLYSCYQDEYRESYQQNDLELIVAGYGRNSQWPAIARIDVRHNTIREEFGEGEFGVAFGGQMDWIQRIVFGTDVNNKVRLQERTESLLDTYRQKINDHLQSQNQSTDIPDPQSFGEELQLFHDWDIDRLSANWPEFSEQNAIDCVDFFINIMIKAQDISARLPTVGGNVHIVVIRKDGFFPVTKEVWRHGDHEVQVPEVRR